MAERRRATGSWRDHEDRPVAAAPPPDDGEASFYVPIGAFQGATYDRNAFALATEREVDALVARTGLRSGHLVLDVGCGTGRHLRALAPRGIGGVGVDVSPELVAVARRETASVGSTAATLAFVVADARAGLHDAVVQSGLVDPGAAGPGVDTPGVDRSGVERLGAQPFDVAWALCQGAFGTSVHGDRRVLAAMASLVRPGGHVVVTAFHALFAARHLVAGQAYDPTTGLLHHTPEVHGPDGAVARFPMWTTTHTAPRLAELAEACGLDVVDVVGAEPGRYDATDLGIDDPELLLLARVPG